MSDIIPPMSLDSEQALIGACLRGGRATYERIKDAITAEMFWSDSHKQVWKAIGKVYDCGYWVECH